MNGSKSGPRTDTRDGSHPEDHSSVYMEWGVAVDEGWVQDIINRVIPVPATETKWIQGHNQSVPTPKRYNGSIS